jgi:hypothetical protein
MCSAMVLMNARLAVTLMSGRNEKVETRVNLMPKSPRSGGYLAEEWTMMIWASGISSSTGAQTCEFCGVKI